VRWFGILEYKQCTEVCICSCISNVCNCLNVILFTLPLHSRLFHCENLYIHTIYIYCIYIFLVVLVRILLFRNLINKNSRKISNSDKFQEVRSITAQQKSRHICFLKDSSVRWCSGLFAPFWNGMVFKNFSFCPPFYQDRARIFFFELSKHCKSVPLRPFYQCCGPRIRMFLNLPNANQDPDLDPVSDPSIIKQN